MSGSPSRSSFAAVTDLLGLRPAPPTGTTPGTARFGVVPSRGTPRFLVPLSFPDATAKSCLAYLGLRDAKTRLVRGSVGLALRANLGRLVVGDEYEADAGAGSLLALLEDLLAEPGEEPGLAVAVGLGSVDEVWKPTLQVFRPDGTPAAFVKIGLGPVAEHLVATEAATLDAWSQYPDPRLVVPSLLADTTWNGIRIAVVAPLPADAQRLTPGLPSAWPVRELDGPEQRALVTDAPWWTGRRAAFADDARIDPLLDRIEQRRGIGADGGAKRWARWHGDWVPWNLARCHRGLIAWDWEYSEAGAPVGLDEVHGAYQQAHVVDGRSIADSLAVAREAASTFARRADTDGSPQALRARAGTPAGPPPDAPGHAAWLADAHVAMLVTRSGELEQRAGTPPHDQAELLAAADAALLVTA